MHLVTILILLIIANSSVFLEIQLTTSHFHIYVCSLDTSKQCYLIIV